MIEFKDKKITSFYNVFSIKLQNSGLQFLGLSLGGSFEEILNIAFKGYNLK